MRSYQFHELPLRDAAILLYNSMQICLTLASRSLSCQPMSNSRPVNGYVCKRIGCFGCKLERINLVGFDAATGQCLNLYVGGLLLCS